MGPDASRGFRDSACVAALRFSNGDDHMGFKENLLKKMEIDRVAAQITASLGTPDSDL